MITFESLFKDETKLGTKIKTDDYLEHGKHPIVDQGQCKVAGYTNLEDGIYTDVPAVIFGDHTRVIKYIDEPFFLGADGTKILKGCEPHSNQKYLYYALRAAKIPNLGYSRHFKCLKELKFVEHSEDEQWRIVFELDKLSKIISLKTKELFLYDNLIKARFVEMFGSTNNEQVKIAELVEQKISTAKKDFEGDAEIKYIDISSINNRRNTMTGFTKYKMSNAPSRARQHVQFGDIIISTVRPNLKNVAMVSMDSDNLVASSGFCVLRPKKCTSEFLMAIVCSDRFTDAMVNVVTGANYPAIKNSDVLNYCVPLLSEEQQRQFANFVTQVDKSKFALQNSIINLMNLWYNTNSMFCERTYGEA